MGISIRSRRAGNGPCQMFQDGSMMEFPKNDVEGPTCKEAVVKLEEQESSKVNSSFLVKEEHPFNGLFSKLANFNTFVGMLVIGFEKEVITDWGKPFKVYSRRKGKT